MQHDSRFSGCVLLCLSVVQASASMAGVKLIDASAMCSWPCHVCQRRPAHGSHRIVHPPVPRQGRPHHDRLRRARLRVHGRARLPLQPALRAAPPGNSTLQPTLCALCLRCMQETALLPTDAPEHSASAQSAAHRCQSSCYAPWHAACHVRCSAHVCICQNSAHQNSNA